MIPITKPSIRRKEMDAVLSCMVSDRIGPAGRQKDLVKQTCELLGADRGAALREYGSAVGLVCDTLRLQEGDTVLLSPLSPAVLYRGLKSRGLRVLFGDVDPDSMTLTPEEARRGIAAGAKALFVDEPLGYIPELEELSALGVPLVEDVSEAIGGHNGQRRCGGYGQLVMLRMEESDIVTAGGGTVVCASGRSWSKALKDAAERVDATAVMSDLNAVLGSVQLKELEYFFERRQELYSYLLDSLRKSRHGSPIQKGEAEPIPYAFPVYVDGSLKETQGYARKKGVETRQAFDDCALTVLDTEDGWDGEARKIAMRTLLFPLYPRLSKKEVETIGKVIATLP
jgi:dTDP-4-amino-4,6-dideoxygalactose transaminase